MSIEQIIADNTAALNRNSDLMERVIACQEAAIAKLEGAPAAKRTRARKEEAPAGNGSPGSAATESAGDGASGASEVTEPPAASQSAAEQAAKSVESLTAYLKSWTSSAPDDAEKNKRVDLLKAVAEKNGVAPGFSTIFPHAKELVFFVERYKAGITDIDLSLDYDLDGDPAQAVEAGPAATSDDEFG